MNGLLWNFRLTVVVWALLALGWLAAPVSPAAAQDARLIVHEWGVLTTVVMPDGQAAPWSPWETVPALPGFVTQLDAAPREDVVFIDIPAIYFRADRQTALSVTITGLTSRFLSCYPSGRYDDHALAWADVTLMPGANMALLTEPSASSYYQARQTTSSLVRVDHQGHKQYERFLSLRGMGRADLPLRMKVDEETFRIEGAVDAGVAQVVVIESHQGKVGFAMHKLEKGKAEVDRLKLDGHVDLAAAQLRQWLNRQGLYPDEARAVVAASQRSWFEPGVRVMYLLPASHVDAFLPSKVTPAPSEHRRLYLVRAELVTPEMTRQMLDQLAGLDPEAPEAAAGCQAFLRTSPLVRPMLRQLLATSADEALKRKIALVFDHDQAVSP